MKPQYEQVTVAPGESWTLLWRELPEIPFIWHYHPEYELTLTLNARGQRHVGDSMERFEPGDLVLVGPNQPHTWAAAERPDPASPMLAIVVWFSSDWLQRLIDGWPEFAGLKHLQRKAGRGMRFSRAMAERVMPLMQALHGLDPPLRLPQLLQVLALLARDRKAGMLATHAIASDDDKTQRRLAKVLRRLHADLSATPRSEELAELAAMSVGAFHRFFKKHTGLTALDYIAQLRVGTASQLLISTDRAIGSIAVDAGYGTAAHFNRQFLARKGMTPREFRSRYRTN
jgi:AraC-like DNA-binding protein